MFVFVKMDTLNNQRMSVILAITNVILVLKKLNVLNVKVNIDLLIKMENVIVSKVLKKLKVILIVRNLKNQLLLFQKLVVKKKKVRKNVL